MLSRKYPKNSKTKSSTKKILGQVFVLLGVIFLLGFLFNFELGDSPLIIILHISGIIGLGLYLIDLAEVKVENEEYS